MSLLRM